MGMMAAIAREPKPRCNFLPQTMLLVIDNYDSFTYNLVQYFGELGAEMLVKRNDEITLDEIAALQARAHRHFARPLHAERSRAFPTTSSARFGPTTPLLGVCLGHQCIGQVFGGEVVRAGRLMHGKTSPILHHGTGVFAGLPNPFEATRYHSLLVKRDTFPDRSRSPPRRRKAKSWACATASTRSTACSSTPSRSSRWKASGCSKTFCGCKAKGVVGRSPSARLRTNRTTMSDDLPPWMQRIKAHTDRVQPPAVRQIGISLVGFSVLLLGILLIPLPGPGSLVILAGLAVLALEFQWAMRWFQRTQALTQSVAARVRVRRAARQ